MEMNVEMEKKTCGGYPATQVSGRRRRLPRGEDARGHNGLSICRGLGAFPIWPFRSRVCGEAEWRSLKIPTQVAETLAYALLFAISPGKPKEFTFSVDESSEEIEARAAVGGR